MTEALSFKINDTETGYLSPDVLQAAEEID